MMQLDFILIHSYATTIDGNLTPILRSRLDYGYNLFIGRTAKKYNCDWKSR